MTCELWPSVLLYLWSTKQARIQRNLSVKATSFCVIIRRHLCCKSTEVRHQRCTPTPLKLWFLGAPFQSIQYQKYKMSRLEWPIILSWSTVPDEWESGVQRVMTDLSSVQLCSMCRAKEAGVLGSLPSRPMWSHVKLRLASLHPGHSSPSRKATTDSVYFHEGCTSREFVSSPSMICGYRIVYIYILSFISHPVILSLGKLLNVSSAYCWLLLSFRLINHAME